MRRAALLAAVLCGATGAPAAAQTPPQRVTIVSVFNPILFGEDAYVNGQLIGDEQGGQTVALEESPFPFTTWAAVASTTTDQNGYYSFKLRPSLTTHYRTVPGSGPGMTSEREVPVEVAPRIALKAVSAGRSSIRFSGSFAPRHDGQSVAIQRQSRGGGWTTVASARLSRGISFGGRLRARRPVVLRAFFVSDGDHLTGYSRPVRAAPGRS